MKPHVGHAEVDRVLCRDSPGSPGYECDGPQGLFRGATCPADFGRTTDPHSSCAAYRAWFRCRQAHRRGGADRPGRVRRLGRGRVTVVGALAPEICYSGSKDSARWRGHAVVDEHRFESYVTSRVKARVDDDEAQGEFAAELRGMATTGMSTEFVENLLRAVPEEKSWAIGEALAECVLADDETREICWPWNLVRDRRTPRASLPGADLVGFCKEGEDVFLLFGEVKTSSDARTPPQVMSGSGGMAWQLKEEATRLDVQHALLKWLRARCRSAEHQALYRAAVHRYVRSCGKEILLVGVLLRDTEPNELDVTARAEALSESLGRPTQIEITAWYLPVPIEDWPTLLHAGGE